METLLDMSLLTPEQVSVSEPVYAIWANLANWSFREACFLLVGLNPKCITEEDFSSKFNGDNSGILELLGRGPYSTKDYRDPRHVVEWALRKKIHLPPGLVKETKHICPRAYEVHGSFLIDQEGRGKSFEYIRLCICKAAFEILGQPPQEHELSLRKPNGQVHLENLATIIDRNRARWPELAQAPWGSTYRNIRDVLSECLGKKEFKPVLVSVNVNKLEA